MKNIKLTSLLKESIAKDLWNKMDPDSREEILLGFVKNPDIAEKMVMMDWDRLPNSVSGNKDFETAVSKAKNLKEADTYRDLKSDINETWDSPQTIENDLYNFLENTFDSGGPEQLKGFLNAMGKAINKAKPLMLKEQSIQEGNASNWSKQQLDKELKALQAGAADAGGLDSSMAFDIADGWISDHPGVDKVIKKYYPRVTDVQGFVANYIA
jgi:hypothetical protein